MKVDYDDWEYIEDDLDGRRLIPDDIKLRLEVICDSRYGINKVGRIGSVTRMGRSKKPITIKIRFSDITAELRIGVDDIDKYNVRIYE